VTCAAFAGALANTQRTRTVNMRFVQDGKTMSTE